MNKTKFSHLILFLGLFIFASCSPFLQDLKEADSHVFHVSEFSFDSNSCLAYIQSDLPVGSVLNLKIDDKQNSVNVDVKQGRLSVNIHEYFIDADMCSKHKVVLSCVGYVSKEFVVYYIPRVEFETTAADKITVFTENARNIKNPEVILYNYSADQIERTDTFYTKNGDTEVKLNSFSDLQEFLSNSEENDSKNAYQKISLRAKVDDSSYDTTLSQKDFTIEYTCKKEVLVRYARIFFDSNYDLIVKMYDKQPDFKNPDDDAKPAGGDLTMQWQRLEDTSTSFSEDDALWTDIEGEESELHKIDKDNDLNKYLRVKIVQTFAGELKNPVYAYYYSQKLDETITPVYPDKLYDIIDSALIDYRYDYVLEGQNGIEISDTYECGFQVTEAHAKFLNAAIDLSTFSQIATTYNYPDPQMQNMTLSKYIKTACVIFDIDNDIYFMPYVSRSFVTVKAVLSDDEMPGLSTDVSNITVGKIKFDGYYSNVEYSLDNVTWKDVDSNFEIDASSSVYVRQKAQGVDGQEGYLKESEARQIIPDESNIGKKTSSGGDIVNIVDVNVSIQSQTEDSVYTLTADISELDPIFSNVNPEDYSITYKWFVDGVIQESTENSIQIDTSLWGSDTRRVSLIVTAKYQNNYTYYEATLELKKIQ